VAEHLDQTPVGIVGESWIVTLLRQTFHALSFRPRLRWCPSSRHREHGTGAHADQQWTLRCAEPSSHHRFQAGQRGCIWRSDLGRKLAAARMYSRQASVWMVKPGGTGSPALVISAKPAPLPPRISFMPLWPSPFRRRRNRHIAWKLGAGLLMTEAGGRWASSLEESERKRIYVARARHATAFAQPLDAPRSVNRSD